MKDIFALLIVVFGASVFQRGFNMLSSGLQNKFANEMYEKMSAFLTPRALDTCQTCGGTGALSSGAAEWPCEDCDGTGKCQ